MEMKLDKDVAKDFVKIGGKKESAGEKRAREVLERRLGIPFTSIRPDWLKGEKGANLEIDGYNEEHRIGFEFNGIQHYEKGHFGMDEKKFAEQVGRDKFKYEIFLTRGIRCIILKNTPVEEIENEIGRQLREIDPHLYKKYLEYDLPWYKKFVNKMKFWRH